MFAGGQVLEDYAQQRAQREMTSLLARVPRFARRKVHGRIEEVPLDAIAVGDCLLIRPGDVVPVDGEIVDGLALLDQSALTGEAMPVSALGGRRGHERQHQCRGCIRPAGQADGVAEHLCRYCPPRRGSPAVEGAHVAPGR